MAASSFTLEAGSARFNGPSAHYGKRLECVRCRYDEETHQRVSRRSNG